MIEIRSDEELFEILTDNPDADILFTDVYGYITEECSMLEESSPGIVNLTKYKDLYVVWIENESPSFTEDDLWKYEIFSSYKRAKNYFESVKNTGIKSIYEQIKECIQKTLDPQNVSIIIEKQPFANMFSVYYKNNLLIEHMRNLDSAAIDDEIRKYNLINEKVAILTIKKSKDRYTNQCAYELDYLGSDGEKRAVKTHIKSILQGQERNVLDVIAEEVSPCKQYSPI